jgi:hypothetical protein
MSNICLRLVGLLLLLVSGASIHAQTVRDSTWKRSDFIANTDQYFSLKLDAHNERDQLEFVTERTIVLRPNTDIRNRLSFNYKWLTLGFSFTVPNLYGNDDEQKGNTETSGFRFALNFDRFSVSFNHSDFTGYYIENSRDFDPSLPDGDFIVLPNFNSKSTRFYVNYLTNKRFSLKSLTSLTERQLKSSGSFLPYFRANYFQTSHGTDTVTSLTGSDNFEMSLGITYSHKFVIVQNFYVSGTGSLGFGNLWYDTRSDDPAKAFSGSTPIVNYQYGISTGYNGNRFFVGALYNRIFNEYRDNDRVTFNTQRNYAEIFIGYRFRVPKFLRKPLDWADDTKQKIIR